MTSALQLMHCRPNRTNSTTLVKTVPDRPLFEFSIIIDQVVDENDNAPVFLHPVSTSGEKNASSDDEADVVVLWHSATSGHVVITVRASDADDGLDADVEYSLIEGNSDRLFNVDRTTGDITLSRSLQGSIDDQV